MLSRVLISAFAFLFLLRGITGVSANFYTDFDITWGDDRAKIGDNGQQLQLTLDRTSGSGFQSKNEYLFAQIDMQIKLVPGDSAGTVTAYYLSSQGSNHDEIDFEFLGNVSGEPYILHTNIFSQGLGNREQQFYLWFDPTKDFHTYSVLWSPQQILLSVDGTPIRVYRNSEDLGVPYPNKQRMRVYSSLWNADDWATRGGLVKIDWTKAPFVASYRNFKAQSLAGNAQTIAATTSESSTQQQQQIQNLDWVRKNYMIYDYCTDTKRFPQGFYGLGPTYVEEVRSHPRGGSQEDQNPLGLIDEEREREREYPRAAVSFEKYSRLKRRRPCLIKRLFGGRFVIRFG